MLVCIKPGPKHEYARKPAGDRWCFHCRKRLPHESVLLGEPPPPEDAAAFEAWLDTGYGYYEPSWFLECAGCKGDFTAFPGTQP